MHTMDTPRQETVSSLHRSSSSVGFAHPAAPQCGAPWLRISNAVCFSAVIGPADAAPPPPECWIRILRKSISFKPVSRAAKIIKLVSIRKPGFCSPRRPNLDRTIGTKSDLETSPKRN